MRKVTVLPSPTTPVTWTTVASQAACGSSRSPQVPVGGDAVEQEGGVQAGADGAGPVGLQGGRVAGDETGSEAEATGAATAPTRAASSARREMCMPHTTKGAAGTCARRWPPRRRGAGRRRRAWRDPVRPARALDGLDAAEEQVAVAEGARRSRPASRSTGDARLGVDRARLEVHARRVDGRVGAPARGRRRRRSSAGSPSGSGWSPRCRARARRRRPAEHDVGAIIDGIRAPAGAVKKPSGLRSSSPMMLLRWIPVPGTTTPEPSPFVHVTAHAIPSASITEMCVVEPSVKPRIAERRDERRRARRLRALHRGDESPGRRRARLARRARRSASASSDAAGVRRRVGQHRRGRGRRRAAARAPIGA